jgi:mono/diheme cytochrome c family protein
MAVAALRWLVVILIFPTAALADAVNRGQYLFTIAGCTNCHTSAKDAAAMVAGGDALKTPFGTFYGPNITPDPATGIGTWSLADFKRAMRRGQRPDGSLYFPVFPYTSYSAMSDQDLDHLWRYLQTLPAVNKPSTAHQIRWPFGWRGSMRFWNWLYLPAAVEHPGADVTATAVERGQYIADHLAHCGECHTPRTILGGRDLDRYWAGGVVEGDDVPNITADNEHGIGEWSTDDLTMLLSIGMLPDGDFVGGSMGHVVDGTSALTAADQAALISYIRTVPAKRHDIAKRK